MSPHPLGLAVLSAALAASLAPLPPQPETPMSEHLMTRVGTWDCTTTVWPSPDAPLTSKGTETVRALGPHVIADYESESAEMPFQGHGVTSWDPTEEAFVTVWVDSIGGAPAILEGTYDESADTLTFRGETLMHGQRMKVRQLFSMQDADHRTFEMFVTPPGGEETPSMRVEYTRR